MKPVLTLLFGNIGSGKSTLSKKLSKTNIIISRDAIRYMIGAGTYTFDIKLEKYVHKSIELILNEFMKSKQNIVLDEVNINKTLRKKWINIAKMNGYDIHVIIFKKLSKYHAVNRRMKNPHGQPDRKLWESVWENFNLMYELPTKNEGISKIINLNE